MHLSDLSLLQPIHTIYTGLKMLSFVHLTQLYDTASNHCKNQVIYKTLYFSVSPSSFCILAKDMNFDCNLIRSIIIYTKL